MVESRNKRKNVFIESLKEAFLLPFTSKENSKKFAMFLLVFLFTAIVFDALFGFPSKSIDAIQKADFSMIFEYLGSFATIIFVSFLVNLLMEGFRLKTYENILKGKKEYADIVKDIGKIFVFAVKNIALGFALFLIFLVAGVIILAGAAIGFFGTVSALNMWSLGNIYILLAAILGIISIILLLIAIIAAIAYIVFALIFVVYVWPYAYWFLLVKTNSIKETLKRTEEIKRIVLNDKYLISFLFVSIFSFAFSLAIALSISNFLGIQIFNLNEFGILKVFSSLDVMQRILLMFVRAVTIWFTISMDLFFINYLHKNKII